MFKLLRGYFRPSNAGTALKKRIDFKLVCVLVALYSFMLRAYVGRQTVEPELCRWIRTCCSSPVDTRTKWTGIANAVFPRAMTSHLRITGHEGRCCSYALAGTLRLSTGNTRHYLSPRFHGRPLRSPRERAGRTRLSKRSVICHLRMYQSRNHGVDVRFRITGPYKRAP